MKRPTNAQKRIIELEDALLNLLEVQITPSTPMEDEWVVALKHARRVLRNKVIKGWHKAPPIDTYELRDEFRVDMGPNYIWDD